MGSWKCKRIISKGSWKAGKNKTLWEAVKIAKDQNIEDLPDQIKMDGINIPNEELAEKFACMFENKLLMGIQTLYV